jgi:hypothetical protein
MLNNPNIVRARTIVTPGGLRVNWHNVSLLTIEKIDDLYYVEISWKYKASIKKEKTQIGGPDFRPKEFFKKYGLIALDENTFINVRNILVIEETSVHGPQEKTLVRIVLQDGFQIVRKLDSKNWAWWKENHA